MFIKRLSPKGSVLSGPFSDKGAGLPGLNQYQASINVLAQGQGHNTVTWVRLDPAAPWSRVKHSTTELPNLEQKPWHSYFHEPPKNKIHLISKQFYN